MEGTGAGDSSRRHCGPRDRRLLSHRCRQCTQSHTKCDGERPCSRCLVRQTQCDEPESRALTTSFLYYESSPSRPTNDVATERLRPSNTSNLITTQVHLLSFFDFVGELPSPISAPFTRTVIEPLQNTSEPINAAISLISELLERKSGDNDENQDIRREKITQGRHNMHVQLSNMLAFPATDVGQPTLIFAMLLCLFELLTDKSGVGFFTVMEMIGGENFRLVRSGPLSRSTVSLSLFYCLVSSFKALVLDEKPAVFEIQQVFDNDTISLLEKSAPDDQLGQFYRICDFLITFSRCNARCYGLIERMRNSSPDHDSRPELHSTNDGQKTEPPFTISGMSDEVATILEEAKDARNKGERLLNPNQSSDSLPTDFSLTTQAFYHASVIALLRLFSHPEWPRIALSLGIEPPTPPEPTVLVAEALAILEAAEARLPLVRLEAIVFAPLLLAAAMEIQETSLRERVVAAFEKIAQKGYVVASTYLEDVRTMWNTTT